VYAYDVMYELLGAVHKRHSHKIAKNWPPSDLHPCPHWTNPLYTDCGPLLWTAPCHLWHHNNKDLLLLLKRKTKNHWRNYVTSEQ